LLTTLAVLARIVANPLSNVFQKQLTSRSADPLVVVGATHALLSLVAAPFLLRPLVVERWGEFLTSMVVCAVLAVAGNVTLVRALRSADLSVLGPINAYKSVVSLVLGIFLIGEVPSLAGLAGVLLIVAGSYFVVDRAEGQRRGHALAAFVRERGVQLRFAALVLSATEAVFLKKALLLSSPLTTFLFWSILGLAVAAPTVALLPGDRVRHEARLFRRHWHTYARLAITTGVMQIATLFTFGALQVGYALALFQLSTVVSVVFGHHVFRERDVGRRLVGSAIMAAGAALIVVLERHG
jgi:drug/metabolite transporter (DMT)-like permease